MVLHFLIQGRVQGVGFRWFVHREASELDLRGWVRNTEEGDVEVVAAGEAADLDDLRSASNAARAAAVSIASSNTHSTKAKPRTSIRSASTERGEKTVVSASVSVVLSAGHTHTPHSHLFPALKR